MTWQRWKGIQKCYPFEESRLEKWEPPYIVQPKFDGVRCRAILLNNDFYILLSSEENIIHSVPHINNTLKHSSFTDAELDGELYCHGMSFEEILSRTSRTKNLHSDYESIQFHIFDIVNVRPQLERTLQLSNLECRLPLTKSPFYLCYSIKQVIETYYKLIDLGYEGIIVRNAFAPYVRKRSTLMMKFKPKKEDNYEILELEEEISKDGIPKGTLGAIKCSSGNSQQFNIGSGFTREERKTLWNDREGLVGKICKVSYQNLTPGKKVPRFPVFVEIVERNPIKRKRRN